MKFCIKHFSTKCWTVVRMSLLFHEGVDAPWTKVVEINHNPGQLREGGMI